MIDHAWESRGRNVLLALDVLEVAEEVLRKECPGFKKGMAGILSKRGFLNYLIGKPAEGLKSALAGYELYLGLKNKSDIAHTCTSLGIIYLELGQTEEAHRFLKEAYATYSEIAFQPGIGVALANLGLLAAKSERLQEAARHYQDALDLMSQTGNKMGVSNMLNNIGALHYKEARYREALGWFRKSLRVNREIGNDAYTAIVLGNLCSAYLGLGMVDRAWRLLAFAYALQQRGTGGSINASLEIVRIRILASPKSAQYSIGDAIHQAEALRETVTDKGTLLELMELIPELYTKAGLLHEAIRCYQGFIRYKQKTSIAEANLRADYAEVVLNIAHAQEREQAERRRRLQVAKVNRELQVLNARKNDFLRMIAHDLKTSAVVVQTLSKMHLSEMTEAQGARPEDDKLTLMASNHILQLIENLKDIDSIESKEPHRPFDLVDVGAVIKQWVRQNRLEAKIKDIRLDLKIADSLPMLETNRLGLNRIFDNLLSNAIKFSPLGSTVTITLNQCDAQLVIRVRDEGPGILESERKLLFKKFGRLSSKPTMGEASTGLGLYISKELSHSMGADLTVENDPRGGAVFSLSLPIEPSLRKGPPK